MSQSAKSDTLFFLIHFKKEALRATRCNRMSLERRVSGAGREEYPRKEVTNACVGVRRGMSGGAEGGDTRLDGRGERKRKAPVANLLREYDVIYGGHYTEGQTNGGY